MNTITRFDEDELLKKFPDEFRGMIHDNAIARSIYMSLLRGESPYNSIFLLLKMNEEQFDLLKRFVESSIPSSIVLDKDELNKLKLYEKTQP